MRSKTDFRISRRAIEICELILRVRLGFRESAFSIEGRDRPSGITGSGDLSLASGALARVSSSADGVQL